MSRLSHKAAKNAPPQAAAISKKLLRDVESKIIQTLLDEDYTLFQSSTFLTKLFWCKNNDLPFLWNSVIKRVVGIFKGG
jgi:hypothetical protein